MRVLPHLDNTAADCCYTCNMVQRLTTAIALALAELHLYGGSYGTGDEAVIAATAILEGALSERSSADEHAEKKHDTGRHE